MAVRPQDYQVPLLMAMIYRGATVSELEATQRRGIELARRHLAREPDDVRAMYLCAGRGGSAGASRRACRSSTARWRWRGTTRRSSTTPLASSRGPGAPSERSSPWRRACGAAGGNPEWIAQDPDFDSLRDDPRFQAIVARPAGE